MNREMKYRNQGWFVFVALLALPLVMCAQNWQEVCPNYPTDDIMSFVRWNGDTLFSFGLNYSISRSDDAGKTWKRISHDANGYNLVRAGATDQSIILLPRATEATLGAFTDTTSTSMFLLSFNPWTHDTTRIEVPLAFPDNIATQEAYDISIRKECIAVLQIRSKVAVVLSTDRGKSWSVNPIPIDFGTAYYGSIEIYDSKRGILIGYSRSSKNVQVWITDDGFNTIREVPNVTYLSNISTFKMFRKPPVAWVDDSTLVVVNNGTVPMVTHDAGSSWKAMARVNSEIGNISFNSRGIGYVACQNHSLYKTTDWGASWIGTLPSMNGDLFTPLALVLNDDAIIVTDVAGHIQRTEDGGITWDENGYFSEYDYRELNFTDKNSGTCIAKDRADGLYYLYKTTNSGNTWLKYYSADISKYPNPYSQIYFVSDQVLFLYGLKANNPLILRTSDGGISWDNVLDTTTCKARQIFRNFGNARTLLHRNNNTVYFYSDKGVLKSTDGGKNWSLRSDSSVVSKSDFMCFDASDTSSLLLLTSRQLLRSTDDGYSWYQLFKIPSGLSYGQLIRTKRGTMFLFLTNQYLDSAYLYKSDNNGASWISYPCPTGGGVVGCVQLFDKGNAFILANNPLEDYPVKLTMHEMPYYIYTAIIGSSGDELKTVKRSITSSRSKYFKWNSYYFMDDDNGWASTKYSIFRTTNGGINWVEMPSRPASGITLDPAYPNPASSSATISFTVSGARDAAVQIDMYDAMGRKVANVYTGVKAPGKHSALFDASRLRAGVYFVRMTTGKEMKVEKLVVMK
jgi:photosystem II stability/assembly factor-like uncharacterized protein